MQLRDYRSCDGRHKMHETLYMLASKAEQPLLAAMLTRHNPQLTVFPALTVADLPAPESGQLEDARLVAFLFPEIVPAAVLEAIGCGAYNVHPGTPDYPGWGADFLRLARPSDHVRLHAACHG
ncbi:MAG: hypothetical protein WDN46_24540 [Methylocella sp.]